MPIYECKVTACGWSTHLKERFLLTDPHFLQVLSKLTGRAFQGIFVIATLRSGLYPQPPLFKAASSL